MGAATKKTRQKPEKVYKKWYKDNSGEFNQKRKDRYANDPEYRERQIANARSRRNSKLLKEVAGSKLMIADGVEAVGLPINYVTEKLGVSEDVIAWWNELGLIPEVRTHYTKKHISLIRPLSKKIPAIKDNHDEVKGRTWFDTTLKKIHDEWEKCSECESK